MQVTWNTRRSGTRSATGLPCMRPFSGADADVCDTLSQYLDTTSVVDGMAFSDAWRAHCVLCKNSATPTPPQLLWQGTNPKANHIDFYDLP